MIKRMFLGIGISICIAASAVAGGIFDTYPIIGGSSFCAATTNGVCVTTVPAGPSALTGNEALPADTNLSGGVSPQTAQIPISLLGAGPVVFSTNLTGDSVTVSAQTRRLILTPAGTLAALTIVFPASTALIDGQIFGLCTTQVITALTLTAGSGTTILNGPTALLVPVATGAASCVQWIYRASNTSWYRIQ